MIGKLPLDVCCNQEHVETTKNIHQSCETCEAFVESSEEFGTCRYNPPVPGSGPSVLGFWPPVRRIWWCKKWAVRRKLVPADEDISK